MSPPAQELALTDADAIIGRIETDRFCDECGFNMRSAPVFRDERTRLLLARCTECGRIHHAATASTAGRVWLNRLGVLAVFLWMAAILFATFMLGVIETAMQAVTLEELTEYSASGRVVRTDMDEYPEYMTLVLSVSSFAAFVMLTLYSCAAHHWKRLYLVMMAALIPLVPMTLAWQAWQSQSPHLELWGWRYLLLHASVQIMAGIIAAIFGRSVMRLLAQVLLPPKTRTLLGFLWLADGKLPPSVK